MTLTPGEIAQLVNGAGVVGLSVLLVVLFIRGVIVPGSEVTKVEAELADMRKDRDDWKAIAIKGTDQTSALVQVAQIFRELQK